MNKNLYLIILTIVTAVCILFGSCYHLTKWGIGFASKFLPFISFEEADNWSYTDSDDIQLDAFSAISVDASVMKLTVRPGEKTSLSYRCTKNLEPHWEVEDGTLFITQKAVKATGKNECSVTLTVPSDTVYSKIDIDLSVGDIDIKDLNGEHLRVNANVGDLDLANLSFSKIELDTNVSDVDVDNCQFDRLNIDANVGDVDVESAEDLSDYSIDLNTNIGSVSVNGQHHRREFSQKGTSGKSITIDTDAGDIDLSYK